MEVKLIKMLDGQQWTATVWQDTKNAVKIILWDIWNFRNNKTYRNKIKTKMHLKQVRTSLVYLFTFLFIYVFIFITAKMCSIIYWIIKYIKLY